MELREDLRAHDVELQTTLICVLVASGESEGFAPSEACTLRMGEGLWFGEGEG